MQAIGVHPVLELYYALLLTHLSSYIPRPVKFASSEGDSLSIEWWPNVMVCVYEPCEEMPHHLDIVVHSLRTHEIKNLCVPIDNLEVASLRTEIEPLFKV